MNYRDTMRYKRYNSLSRLLMLLVKFEIHNYTLYGWQVDSFHEKMGTPNA